MCDPDLTREFYFKALPFSFCVEVFFLECVCVSLADRCRRFLEYGTNCVSHQLLSGQLSQSPTPTVS